MTRKHIELISVKQRFLFNGPQKVTGNIIKSLNDKILSSVNFNEAKVLDNKAEFGVNVLINKDKQHLILQIAFIYGYGDRNEDDPKYYSILGRFDSLIKIQNPIKDDTEMSKFINRNILIMIEPIMNSISKSISETTAEVLDFPIGIDMYGRFERMMQNNNEDLLK